MPRLWQGLQACCFSLEASLGAFPLLEARCKVPVVQAPAGPIDGGSRHPFGYGRVPPERQGPHCPHDEPPAGSVCRRDCHLVRLPRHIHKVPLGLTPTHGRESVDIEARGRWYDEPTRLCWTRLQHHPSLCYIHHLDCLVPFINPSILGS